jgi:uncharacterized protein (UPF0264 family)
VIGVPGTRERVVVTLCQLLTAESIPMADLLVSVRSVAEAAAALAGGAAVIDVKDPNRGSLGRAAETDMRAIIDFVAGRRLVTIALGELCEEPIPPRLQAVGLAKWGLAGLGSDPRWRSALADAGERLSATCQGCRPVAVAYADWEEASAPHPSDVCAFACERRWPALLIDTHHKDGCNLLHWMQPRDLSAIIQRCRSAGVRVALAGSLGPDQIASLAHLDPDWFAVRGSACESSDRTTAISVRRVRALANQLGCSETSGSSSPVKAAQDSARSAASTASA